MRITERTFGIELEYADMDKSKIIMPEGFGWDEEEVIHNTDMTRGTVTYQYGGEINTPPMLLNHETTDPMKDLVRQCAAAGAVARRDCSVQVHIYIGDLSLDEVKRIYSLVYFTSGIIKQLCNLPPYCDQQKYRKAPTADYYVRVMAAESFSDLQRIFENSHNKGFTRHFVNVASYFVRKTVEFRIFNSTTDIQEMTDCVLFAYRFVDYAIKHTEEDFRNIVDVADFVKKLKVKPKYPELPDSLMFFSSVKEMDVGRTEHKSTPLSSKLAGVLERNSGNELSLVNPRLYSLEVRMSKNKRIHIYNADEYHHIIYQMAKEGLKVRYSGKLEFLQEYNDDRAESQIACLLILFKVNKFLRDVKVCVDKLESFKQNLPKTIEKARHEAEKIVALLGSSEYTFGTLNDAKKDGGDIFFQFDDYSKFRSCVLALKKHSNYSGKVERLHTQYLNVTDNTDGRIMFVSQYLHHEHLSKVAKVSDLVFYSTKQDKTEIESHQTHLKNSVTFPVPPDDLSIDDPSKLRIERVPSGIFFQAQQQFIKKVQKVMKVRFCFFVYYEKHFIGGFGFDFPKDRTYSMWLVSDFCTNNNVPRLSKLILLLTKCEETHKKINRCAYEVMNDFYTKVYTHSPVSMKYRSLFKLEARESNHLLYSTQFGTSGNIDQVMTKYKQFRDKAK